MGLSDLLEAERALGRLIEALKEDDARGLWSADARRREAIASADLDDARIDWEDLVVAHLSPSLLPQGLRSGTLGPLQLIATAQRLQGGIPATDLPGDDTETEIPGDDTETEIPGDDMIDRAASTAGGPLKPGRGFDISEIRAAARQSTADITAFILAPERPLPEPTHGADSEIKPAPLLVPLSAPWLAAAWARLCPDREPLPSASGMAARIDESFERPGLMGVARALQRLHDEALYPHPMVPDYGNARVPTDIRQALALAKAEHQPITPGWRFARLLAPWLIQRACEPSSLGAWVSVALRSARHGYATALGASDEDWSAWLYPVLARGFDRERLRLHELTAVQAAWESKFSAKRRWNSSRRALGLLIDQPAITTRYLEQRRDFSRRAAQMLVREWMDVGILRHVHHAHGQEWWIADQVRGRG